MYHLSTEHRLIDKQTLPNNITHHISHYQIYGNAVVVTNTPEKMLPELRAAWLNLKREMREEIDSSTNKERKALLTNQLMYMQYCNFTNTPPIENPNEKVIVTSIEHLLEYAPICQTMYVTCPIEKADIHRATSWMPPYGLLVFYDFKSDRRQQKREQP